MVIEHERRNRRRGHPCRFIHFRHSGPWRWDSVRSHPALGGLRPADSGHSPRVFAERLEHHVGPHPIRPRRSRELERGVADGTGCRRHGSHRRSGSAPASGVLALFAGAVTVAALRALRGSRSGTQSSAEHRESSEPDPRFRNGFRAGIGALVGFVGGLLGIGVGFIVAPAFLALGYPPKQAAATTALVVIVCSFAGVAGYVPYLDFPVILACVAIKLVWEVSASVLS